MTLAKNNRIKLQVKVPESLWHRARVVALANRESMAEFVRIAIGERLGKLDWAKKVSRDH